MKASSDTPGDLTSRPAAAGAHEVLVWLGAAWLCSIFCGIVVLRSSGALAAGNVVSLDRAVLTSVSAATLTGFTQDFANFADFNAVVRGTLAAESLLGTALTLLAGGMGLNRTLGGRHRDRDIAWASGVLIVSAAVVGAALLPGKDPLGPALNGVFAVGGSNLSAGFDPSQRPALALGVLFPLAFAGAAGPLLLLEVFAWILKRRALTRHGRQTLAWLAGTYVAFTALLLGSAYLTGGSADVLRLAPGVQAGGVAVTGGDGSRVVVWLLMLLIAAGVGTAGTAGGVGFAWRFTLNPAHARVVVRFLLIQAAVTFVGLLVLSVTDPQLPADRGALLSVAAAFNVGVSPQPIGLVGPGAYAVSLLMLMGRLLPLALVWSLRPTSDDD